MQNFTIDTGDWNAFWERWGETIEQFPKLREQLLEKVGQRTERLVQNSIVSSGVHDFSGRVRRWQDHYIGSKKRYVSVRANREESPIAVGYKHTETTFFDKRKGKRVDMNAGALTNFLASGHRIRYPSGRTKRYIPRARMTRVRGHDFYKQAKAEAERIALREAEDFLKGLQL